MRELLFWGGVLQDREKIALRPAEVLDLREVGLRQRRLLLAMGLGIAAVGVAAGALIWVAIYPIVGLVPKNLDNFFGEVFRTSTVILDVVYVYLLWRLLSALRYSVFPRVALVVGCCVPVVGWAVLLLVSNRATRPLKQAGIKVGLFGAKLADLPQA